ncbi:hypothetical protein EDC01DRAFT_787252 [Geopyxis carbonaria]|nr:hypothetical protein EDC01DRAFT_787252 [Geopyxis carbonaria]
MTRRTSTRVRKAANYATADAYKDLGDDDDAPAAAASSDADDDFTIPDAPPAGGDAASSSSELSDPPASEDDEPEVEEEEVSEEDGEEETGPSEGARVHKKHLRTLSSGKGKGKRKARLIAEGGNPADARIPDPSVRITYRPGFSKATGKRDRLQHIFGAATDVLVKAVWVRDQAIGLPAIPTKASLGYTPFWDRESEVGPEVLGAGAQVERELDYGDDGEGVRGFLPPPTPESEIRCILGPTGAQKVINFKRFGIHNLADIDARKNAYLLNAGGMVAGLDWAPNRPDGTQYLALSTVSDSPRLPGGHRDGERPPAYDKRPSQACIQLWSFPVSGTHAISKPCLSVVLCHSWGPARSLKWCPAAYTPARPQELGYLAGVFADGAARVLRIDLPAAASAAPQYCNFTLFTTAAYTCALPHDVVTTLSWASATTLVAGTASGSIAAWDLAAPEHADPYLYLPVHHTYITQLATCYPSFPHTVVSSSMDGYCRATSLLDPAADVVPNNRSRIASAAIAWIDALQAAVSCEESTWVKFFPLRRFFSSTTVCKHHGVVRCIAGSVAHTLLLTGGTEGEAVFSNPTRRVFHGKIKNYQQTWFLLEYAAHTRMFRMTEGFRLEECEHKTKNNNKSSQIYSAVYPVEVGITGVCWNPNVRYGGWATAAASCGLVRVEDVAY